MLHSDERILTTHVGALPRSAELEQKVQAHRLDESVPLDGLREEVAQSVRDCGLGGRIHQQLVWAKLRAMADGAKLASERLWGAPVGGRA